MDQDMSQTSPRSTLSDGAKMKKQTTKLAEMKQDALKQLIGLEMFQLMFYSKCSFSATLSDEDLLEGFKKRFKTALPIKYFDIMLVNDLSPKAPTPEEQRLESAGT